MGQPRRLQVAVIGAGRLGAACARALLEDEDLALAGIVRRTDSSGELPAGLRRHAVVTHVTHVRDLPLVEAALVCVPAQQVAVDPDPQLLQKARERGWAVMSLRG